MRKILFPFVIGLVVATTAAWSAWNYRDDQPAAEGTRKPWTGQPLNNSEETFRFAVVSDRTGGHRAEVFSKAVHQLNLMQPEFVLSVGDLIEGYSEKQPEVEAMWKEFDTYVNLLQMPFYHVPGNHDVTNPIMAQTWKSKFGKIYYHFIYKNVLFLCLNTEDFGEAKKGARISPEQTAYFAKVLEDNPRVTWTVVALHKPLWNTANAEELGWTAFEKVLQDRPYTVFAGHVHHYEKFVRFGRNYYQLATTGGGSKLRGLQYGEFDHITWVTMKKDGPVIANVLLSGILPEDLRAVQPVAQEKGTVIKDRRVCHGAGGTLLLDGQPVENADVVFHYMVPPAEQEKLKRKTLRTADAVSDAAGRFRLSTYTSGDGAPTGEFIITVVPFKSRTGLPVNAPTIAARYAKVETSPLRANVKEGVNDFKIEIDSK